MARPDQTEKPTAKRRSEARGRGQVAKSTDITGGASFLVVAIVLHMGLFPTMFSVGHGLEIMLQSIATHEELNIRSCWALFARALSTAAPLVLTLFACTVTIGILGNVAQFGFVFTLKRLQPKFTALNPISGFRNVLVSKQTLVNLVKQLIKLGMVALLLYTTIHGSIPQFYSLGEMAPLDVLHYVDNLVFSIGWRFGLFVFILGLADYAWEKYRLTDSLKMTKAEVKDEAKQSEGSPEAKGEQKKRIRSMHRKRMMAAVPRATVVVTNPTHFACALEWNENSMEAPVLVAKGADLMATAIRRVAAEHGIPVLENPPLARELYYKVPLDTPIPPNLYSAVAQVIAFVFRLKQTA